MSIQATDIQVVMLVLLGTLLSQVTAHPSTLEQQQEAEKQVQGQAEGQEPGHKNKTRKNESIS